LGPHVFSIYVNDLPLVVRHCLYILFADDTQLSIAGPPSQLESLLAKLKEDLDRVIAWLKLHGMKLNAAKTQLIMLGSAKNLGRLGRVSIEVDGVTIESSETLNSLGLVFDSKLTWVNQINKMSRSFHPVARSLYPLRNLMSSEHFRLVFNACANSLLQYMSIIWGTASKKDLRILERSLRSSARVLL